MGLDQYILKRNKMLTNALVWKDQDDSETEVAYWRKNFSINQWFAEHVDGFDNNAYSLITKSCIEELRHSCKQIIEASQNSDKDAEEIATKLGFDEFYIDDIEDFIYSVTNQLKKITEILNTINWEMEELYYYPSW